MRSLFRSTITSFLSPAFKDGVCAAAGIAAIGTLFAGFVLVGFCLTVGALAYAGIRINLEALGGSFARRFGRAA